jgi:hypothetical protein
MITLNIFLILLSQALGIVLLCLVADFHAYRDASVILSALRMINGSDESPKIKGRAP